MRTPATLLAVCLLLLGLSSFLPKSQRVTARQSNAGPGSGFRLFAPQKGKPSPTPDVPVTVTIADFIDVIDGGGETQRIWMQIRSDGGGVYTHSPDVESIINDSSSPWYLTMLTQARHVFVDFSNPIPSSGPNGGAPVAPFSAALVTARLVSKCGFYDNNFLSIPPGATVNCPLSVLFSVSGNDYQLQMNPMEGAFVFPHTDYADVTCNSAANSKCNDWTFTPNGSKGGCVTADCAVKQNVARLSKVVTARGKTTTVNQGDFLVAFSIGITNP